MNILKDEAAQTSAEFILLFGGVIVIVIVFALLYKNYIIGLGNGINGTNGTTLNNTLDQINNLKTYLQ